MVLWRSLTRLVSRFFVAPGLLFASAPVSPEYPVENSLSTMARFPWIWACVQQIATDQASRPLIAYVASADGKRQRVSDSALTLFEAPNPTTTEFLFRKQLWVDLLLPGNAYIWQPPGEGAIYRLHPARTRPLPGPLGVVVAYEWTDDDGRPRILSSDEVTHIRDVSWQETTAALLGESVIRCLHDDLTLELNAKKTAIQAAARGRPDILFSSKEQLGEKGGEAIIKRWESSVAKRAGAFFAGNEITATQLSWSPKDSGDLERSVALRDLILGIFGVPPGRLGISSANYATERQQEKGYWERLMARARLLDDALSRFAAPGHRIGHDYGNIEALQASQTERLARVQIWVSLGWSPEDACAIEGFTGLPARTGEPTGTAKPAKPASDDEPAEPADKALPARVRAAISLHLRCAEAAYSELGQGVDTALFVRWQTERLFASLAEAGIEAASARAWAEEVAGTLDEAWKMGLGDAFADARAGSLASRIATAARRAA